MFRKSAVANKLKIRQGTFKSSSRQQLKGTSENTYFFFAEAKIGF